jgi:hypothetical protein
MSAAPSPSNPYAIYYPGEQEHARASEAMTPQALAQVNASCIK